MTTIGNGWASYEGILIKMIQEISIKVKCMDKEH